MSNEEQQAGHCNAQTRDGGYCGRKVADPDSRCYMHGGAAENDGNDHAVSHGAYREHATRFLTDGEQTAFDEAVSLLDSPDGAQDVGRTAAATCLMRYDRSGDPRFLRRFEGICDKFNIAPEDALNVEHSGPGGGPISVTINETVVESDWTPDAEGTSDSEDTE